MRTLSADYLTAAKASGRYPDIKAVIADVGTLTGHNEIVELHITRGITAKPEYYDNMLALSSECRMTVDRRRLSDEQNIVSGKQLQVFAAFNNPDGAEIANELIGTFFVSSYDTSDKETGIITASDALVYTGVDFDPETLTYPVSLSDMFEEAFLQAGITLSEVELDIDPKVYAPPYKAEEPVAEGMNGSPYSCREIVARIAGMNLGALFIAADGTPTIEKYGSVDTTAIPDNIVYDVRKGSETFYIDQIRVFSTEEKMAKKRTNYLKLPYAPRFESMGSPKSGTTWHDEIVAKAGDVCDKPWTTATVSMQGVGEVEIGDLVQAAGAVLHVSGITYDFANAHFVETLYSFAWTEEEYLMTHPAIENATGIQKAAKTIYSATDPLLDLANGIKLGDSWGMLTAGSTALTTMYKRVKNQTTGDEEWKEDYSIPAGGGSGGVGEAVGNHSERFNYYGTEYGVNVIDDSDGGQGNRAGGQENNLYGCRFMDVYGYANTVKLSANGYIQGNGNKIEYNNSQSSDRPSNFIIIGASNTNYDESSGRYGAIRNSGVIGINRIYGPLNESLVVGDGVRIQGTVSESLIIGKDVDIGNADQVIYVGTGGGVASGDRIVAGDSSNGICFKADRYGNAYAKQWQTLGADYAEMFEWLDGNPGNEDRRGLLVTFAGDKIILAHGDNFTGIISTNPSVLGNNPLHWHGKYKTDVFGAALLDNKGEPMLSDEYDPEREYIPRLKRPEWSPVGLMGQLVIVDDGSCIPGEFVSARQGRGTKCYKNTGARVLRRLDDTHVEVLFGGR